MFRTDPPANLALSAHKPATARTPPPAAKAAPANPTRYVLVSNMFNADECAKFLVDDTIDADNLCRETERDWDLDLAEDITTELNNKYGKPAHLKVDKMSSSVCPSLFDFISAS